MARRPAARKVFVPYETCHGNTNESYKFGFRIILPKMADDASLNGFVAKTLKLMMQCTRYTLNNGQFLLQHQPNTIVKGGTLAAGLL